MRTSEINTCTLTIDIERGNLGKVELKRTLFIEDTKAHLNNNGKE